MSPRCRTTYVFCSTCPPKLPEDGWLQNCYACAMCITAQTLPLPMDDEQKSQLCKPTEIQVYVCPECQRHYSKYADAKKELWERVWKYVSQSSLTKRP